MQRGEVWWATVAPPPVRDPTPHAVLLLSWDAAHRFRDRITVAPITSTIRGLDAEVFLDHRDGMHTGCVANLDIISTILRQTLTERITRLSDSRMAEVERAIHIALGVPLPCGIRE
ncbi:MAG TPA: type II toxin-antitoxin system PemK/MazF family toxin [Candidatus Dormibacteraeota bacterium]|nr:type II toxin-antitoxin system PemK/MazF family toxin [Candidatus Dormibacteraeota bacterium]